jgi:surface protein
MPVKVGKRNKCPGYELALDNISIKTAVTDWLADKLTATATYGPIACWNTSAVKDLESLFDDRYYDSTNFNEVLTYWDTSKVTTMQYMFYSCDIFNGDVSQWDVSSITDMQSIFSGASAFDRDVSRDVSSVTDMSRMFLQA